MWALLHLWGGSRVQGLSVLVSSPLRWAEGGGGKVSLKRGRWLFHRWERRWGKNGPNPADNKRRRSHPKLINSGKRREGTEGTTTTAAVGEIILLFIGSIVALTWEAPHMPLSGEHPGTVANAFMANFSFTCNNCCLCSHRSVIDGLTGFPLACSRGDGADVQEDAARCVFLRVMPAAIRFPSRKVLLRNSCFCTSSFFHSCKVEVDWLAVRVLAWLHNATPRLRPRDEYFSPLMGNYGAQRVSVINRTVTPDRQRCQTRVSATSDSTVELRL